MTGVILAGGENRRIPLLKGHIEINGRRIIDSTVELFRRIFERVVISTNSPESYFYCGVPMVGDLVRQRGPATGILSVLLHTGEDAIFVVACDMPFIKPALIRYMLDKYKTACGSCDAVAPVFEGKPQPLCAIYSRNIISAIEKRLINGHRSLRDMLTESDVFYIKEDEIRAIDPEGKSFVNINTMEDLEKVISVSE